MPAQRRGLIVAVVNGEAGVSASGGDGQIEVVTSFASMMPVTAGVCTGKVTASRAAVDEASVQGQAVSSGLGGRAGALERWR